MSAILFLLTGSYLLWIAAYFCSRAEQPEEESGKGRADPYPDGGGRERDFRQKHIFP